MKNLDQALKKIMSKEYLSASLENVKENEQLFSNSLDDLKKRIKIIIASIKKGDDPEYNNFQVLSLKIPNAEKILKDLTLNRLKAENILAEGSNQVEILAQAIFHCKMLLSLLNHLISTYHYEYLNIALKINELLPYLYSSIL